MTDNEINPQEVLESVLVEDAPTVEATEETQATDDAQQLIEAVESVETEEATETTDKEPELDPDAKALIESIESIEEVTPDKIITQEEVLQKEVEELLQNPVVVTGDLYRGKDGKTLALQDFDGKFIDFSNEVDVRQQLHFQQQQGNFENVLLIEKNYKQYLENKQVLETANQKYWELENKEWAVKSSKYKQLIKDQFDYVPTQGELDEIDVYIQNVANSGRYNPKQKDALIREAVSKTTLGKTLKEKRLSAKAGPKAQAAPDSKVKPKSVTAVTSGDAIEKIKGKDYRHISDEDLAGAWSEMKSLLK